MAVRYFMDNQEWALQTIIGMMKTIHYSNMSSQRIGALPVIGEVDTLYPTM